MTIVVGYRPEGSDRVWLASDTRTTGGCFVFPERGRKLHRGGGWLVGASGPDRIQEFLGRCEPMPADTAGIFALRDYIMAWMRESDWEPEKQDRGGDPRGYNFSAIAARAGELWGIAADGSVWSPAWGFAAIGSGQDFAYGAAYCAIKCDMGSQRGEDVVALAVSAAMEFRADCGGEIDIESVE